MFSHTHAQTHTHAHSQPFVSFFKHGKIAQENGGESLVEAAAANLHHHQQERGGDPFVRFGRFTSPNVPFVPNTRLDNSGVNDVTPALHMVLKWFSLYLYIVEA